MTALLGYAVPRLVVAGTHSGVGKTSVALGLTVALRRLGLAVAPFKVGPDFVDPAFHARAAGRPARNLDGWLLPPAELTRTLLRGAADADLALIEGMMGLYDGRSATSEEGSTAAVAKALDAPVLLVIDASAVARSAAATVLGFKHLDPRVRLAGVVANGVGSVGHRALVRDAVAEATGIPLLGTLPREAALALPERHLGLVLPGEVAGLAEVLDRLGDLVAERFDLGALRALAALTPPLEEPARGSPVGPELGAPATGEAGLPGPTGGPPPRTPRTPRTLRTLSRVWPPAEPGTSAGPARPRRPGSPVRVAVAQDEAFAFYYPENLELLAALGATIVRFSPLRDRALPPGAAGLYLGGGYPELHAAALAANRPLLRALREADAQGMPIYAECGGLMYLTRGLAAAEGARHHWVGLVPTWTTMAGARLRVGYVAGQIAGATALGPPGTLVRGHVFHRSDLAPPLPASTAAFALTEPTAAPEGFAHGDLVASYVHLHFGAVPAVAAHWLERCHAWQRRGAR